MKERVQSLLAEVGFSGLEAEVYLALLREPCATGYRAAQMVGKPVANTYKALDSLRVKGAVVADETSGTRTYAALSIHEYLDGMRRNLETKQELIEQELKDVAATPMHGGIFELTNVEQVYERCRRLLRDAKSIALLDIDARPLHELRSELTTAAKRGVKVLIKTYAPAEIPGCEILAPKKDVTHSFWNGDWLNVIIDWREYVQSFLKPNGTGVWEALWSRNPYLAVQVCNGCLNELILTRAALMMSADADPKAISQEVRRLSKRYLEDSPLADVIPERWLVDEARKRLKAAKRNGTRKGAEQCKESSTAAKDGADK
jgi:sugar-specific transcriptional regulator TrmB